MTILVRVKGGPGSGNWGHRGRPGLVGGSSGSGALPNTFSTDYAERVKAKADVGLAYISAAYDMTEEEYSLAVEEVMRKQLEAGSIKLRLSERALAQVMDSGEVVNTFDAGKSSAAYGENGLRYSTYLEHRRDLEFDMYGIPKDADGSERPIYGFFELPQGKAGTMFDAYGSVSIVLKSGVKERTMYTDGDSLDYGRYDRFVPSPVNSPSVRSSLFLTNFGNPLGWWESGIDKVGAEAQIFGGVKVSDIDMVQFDVQPESSALVARLDSAGVPWSVR